MITTVENEKEITRLQRQMMEALLRHRHESIEAMVGYQGGNEPATIHYFEKDDFWVAFQRGDIKYWNGFGIGKPVEGRNHSIVCEINIPYDGINRRIAGVFGQEGDQVVLLHRGNIGGGRTGVGKRLFYEYYRGAKMAVQDGDTENTLALIGSLDSVHFVQQVANFVHEVHRIKDMSQDVPEVVEDETEEAENPVFNFDFKEEGFGKRRYTRKDEIEAYSNHGIIINALAQQLTSRGLAVGNDRKRDLYTVNDNQINRIFEAKTDLSNSSIYSAVGQLLMYSAEKGLDGNQKILVLPEKLKATAEKVIGKLGLDILYYDFQNEAVRFIDMDRLLDEK